MKGPIWAFPQQQAASSIRRQLAKDLIKRRARGELPPRPQSEPVLGVRHHACRWPMWPDGAPAPQPPPFCDAPVVPGRSWCPEHKARAYLPPWMRWEPIPVRPSPPPPLPFEEPPMSENMNRVGANADVRSFFERAKALEQERRDAAEALRDLFVEVKSAGFNTAAMRSLLRESFETDKQRDARLDREMSITLMRAGLGEFVNTPLGVAAMAGA